MSSHLYIESTTLIIILHMGVVKAPVCNRKRGYEKPAWLTPAEFAKVIPESDTAQVVREFTDLYQELRYGNRPAAGELMLGLLNHLESSAVQPGR